MKKLTLFTFILVCIAIGGITLLVRSLFFVRSTLNTATSSTPVPNDTISTQKLSTVTVHEETYVYAFFETTSTARISLVPNFSEKMGSSTMIGDLGCQQAINGGFYDTSDRPLGLFITNNQTLRNQVANTLINGFIWATRNGAAGITRELPAGPFAFALQTGPLLMLNGSALPLKLKSDEHARRMVAAKTPKGFAFIALYSEDSAFGGPFLVDLPEVIQAIDVREHFDMIDAINLDGGSASAFANGETTLSELKPIGSLFCVK